MSTYSYAKYTRKQASTITFPKIILCAFFLISLLSSVSAPADDVVLQNTRQTAVLFYTKSFQLQTNNGSRIIMVNKQPIKLPASANVKFIFVSSPSNPNGHPILFIQLKDSWCYLSPKVIVSPSAPPSGHVPGEITMESLIGQAEALHPGPSRVQENIVKELLDSDTLHISDAQIDQPPPEQSAMEQKNFSFLEQRAVPIPILASVQSGGAISTEDLSPSEKSLSAFNNEHFRLYPFFHNHSGATISISPEELATAESWMAAWCAANNSTISSRSGQVSLGGVWLDRNVTTVESNRYDVRYWVIYFGLGKSKGKIGNISYGVDPEVDFGANNLIPFPSSWIKAYDQVLNPAYPNITYDKKSGTSESISLQTKTWNPNQPNTAGYDPKEGLAVNVNGGNSFDHDYYNVTAGPTWTFTKGDSPIGGENPVIGGNFIRSLAPQGTGTKEVTAGEFTGEMKRISEDRQNQSTYDLSLDYSNVVGEPATSKPPSVNTDEYSGTFSFQNLTYFPNRTGKALSPDLDGQPDGEFDINAWVKPTESTQFSNFYSDGIGKFHFGADVPLFGSHQVLRLDWSVTGGGIIGVTPATDRFYAGSNLAEGVSQTGNSIPSPVIRSLGTNSAGVYSPLQKASGATAFANEDLTLAFPLPFPPFCSSAIIPDDERKGFVDQCVSLFGGDVQDQNNLFYVANYERFFAVKPLLTCDAVWLGAPEGFSDRSIASVGAGGEISIGVINFDIIYAYTIYDTSTQTKSDNLTFQATYDIHF